MGIIARIYDFVAGTRIKSAEVDAELNQLVSSHNAHDAEIDALESGSGLGDGTIVNSKLAAGIDAAKVGAGGVSNTEYGYIGTLRSDVQGQIDTNNTAQTAALTVHKSSSDHDGRYYTEAEIDAQNALLETKSDLTINRKLSATGDFTGTILGLPVTLTDPYLSSAFAALKVDVKQRAFNIVEYGAILDGTTDNTLAIKAAMAAASAAGGGEVFFPAGECVYSTYVTPTSNVTFNGIRGASIIKMKPSVLPTFGFFNVGSVDNIKVTNLSFVGNAVAPTVSGAAEVAFFMLNCSNILFSDCHFTGYMGIGIGFQGGTDTHVINCKFEAMGQLQIGLTPKKSVPAVWAAYSNKGLKVINCEFEDCRWAGVYMLGVDGVTAYCRMNNIGETGIYSEYSDTSPTNSNQVLNNRISNVYQVDVTGCGVEWSTPNSLLQGNVISLCAADGIGIGPCNNTTVAHNTSYNHNVGNTLSGRGIGVNNKGGVMSFVTGKGIKLIGNTCYDDRAVPLQLYGIEAQALFSGTNFSNCIITNNILYGNVTADLNIESGKMDDPTNVIKFNGGVVTPNQPVNEPKQNLINGNFNVWQRGTTFTNPADSTFTADHWQIGAGMATPPTNIIHKKQLLTSGDYLNSAYCYRVSPDGSGSTSASDQYTIRQRAENKTRDLCGPSKKITVVVVARSSIVGKKIGLGGKQKYGTGGSPSATETLMGTVKTLTTSFKSYEYTFTTNTLVGKTFGTNNDDHLQVELFLNWGSTTGAASLNSSTNESFVGAGDIDIIQFQVYAGNAPALFQPITLADETSNTQRYTWIPQTNSVFARLTSYTANTLVFDVPLPVQLRATPTIRGTIMTDYAVNTVAGVAQTLLTASSVVLTSSGVRVTITKTAHGLTDAVLEIKTTSGFEAEI